MTDKAIPPQVHRRFIDAFTAERPSYEKYADVLRCMLQRACAVSIPDAYVQARAKTTSSFAEKCVRKFGKYKDPLRDMTDLCGARVIVQTLEQVEAVKQFIEANFEVIERDEKGVSLGEERFGYRDLHFIVRLDPVRVTVACATGENLKAIGDRKAEIQVRTWLQHAWADTLHDRVYKAPFRLSPAIRRTGNLLAALMEEGDRNYDTLVDELDGMIANYAAFATRANVENEVKAQRLILDNEPDAEKKPGLALRLGRLLAACGDYDGVVAVLNAHRNVQDANRCELLQDLGYALCKVHRAAPGSADYQRGLKLLEEAQHLCGDARGGFVVHRQKRESLIARSLSRRAWALEVLQPKLKDARDLHAAAHAHEPHNPYYLADMLGCEVSITKQRQQSGALLTVLREALNTCRAHTEHGIELPRAYFTAGRLHLLLGEPPDAREYHALRYYAQGIRHCLAGTFCVPDDALSVEREWIERLSVGVDPPEADRWMMDVLDIAEGLRTGGTGDSAPGAPEVLIVSGGAASIAAEMLERCRPLLKAVLASFDGRAISGGTISGVPGLVGAVAHELGSAKRFEAIGYIPSHLPHDAPEDSRYDRRIVCGESAFTPQQVIQSWKDIVAEGVSPRKVLCLGFGGGPLSVVDYAIALSLGASVVVALGSGGAADAITADPLWAHLPNLMPLPMDEATFHGLLTSPGRTLDDGTLVAMAQELHQRYVAASTHRLPDTMRPWTGLSETYKRANREQARHAVRILESVGFVVEPAADPNQLAIFNHEDFTTDEIERMAELEHGRWNVERVRAGWRFGKHRDDARFIHDRIVSWAEVPDDIKKYDRDAVRAFPAILAVAGLEVRRRGAL